MRAPKYWPCLLTMAVGVLLACAQSQPVPTPAPSSAVATSTPTPPPVPVIGVAEPDVERWLNQFSDTEAEYIEDITLDKDRAILAVGWTVGDLPGHTNLGVSDAFVRKLDSDGAVQWIRQFGTTRGDYAFGVASNAEGNIYVTGRTQGTLPGETAAGGWDAYLVKYNASGDELWTRQFGSDGVDYAERVAVDGGGNAYVVGRTDRALPGHQSIGFWDLFLVKYSPSSKEVWSLQFGTDLDDYALSVALDSAGDVYVVGRTEGDLVRKIGDEGKDAFLLKVDASGVSAWLRQFGTPEDDEALDVVVDAEGNIYVTGWTEGTLAGALSQGERDAFLTRFTSSGEEVWSVQFGSEQNDYGQGVAVDEDGNVYVTGRPGGAFSDQRKLWLGDSFVRMHDASGAFIWGGSINTGWDDYVAAIAVNARGQVYIGGFSACAVPGQTSGTDSPTAVAFVTSMDRRSRP